MYRRTFLLHCSGSTVSTSTMSLIHVYVSSCLCSASCLHSAAFMLQKTDWLFNRVSVPRCIITSNSVYVHDVQKCLRSTIRTNDKVCVLPCLCSTVLLCSTVSKFNSGSVPSHDCSTVSLLHAMFHRVSVPPCLCSTIRSIMATFYRVYVSLHLCYNTSTIRRAYAPSLKLGFRSLCDMVSFWLTVSDGLGL